MPNGWNTKTAVFVTCVLIGAAGPLLGPAPGSAGEPDPIRFRPLSCIDRQGTGQEAFRVLVPDGWTFTGGMKWILDNPGLPATAAFTVSSPDGKTAFQILPTQPFFWTNIPKILSEHPRGSRYYGREVLPPMQPVEALKEIVLPRFRPDAKQLEVTGEYTRPDLGAGLGAGILTQPDAESRASGAGIRIEYTTGGIQLQEEIYCVVHTILFHFRAPTGTQSTMMWNAGYLLSCRSEQKDFEAEAGILETVSFSFRWNPEWYSKYCQLVAYMMLKRVERLTDMEQLARILSHAKGEPNETLSGYYREHQGVYARISERFSAQNRGTETYRDPLSNQDVRLPRGYRKAWVNAQGEYILSRNPAFTPVPAPDGPWREMRALGLP